MDCTRGQFEGGNFAVNEAKDIAGGLRIMGREKKREWREGKDEKC